MDDADDILPFFVHRFLNACDLEAALLVFQRLIILESGEKLTIMLVRCAPPSPAGRLANCPWPRRSARREVKALSPAAVPQTILDGDCQRTTKIIEKVFPAANGSGGI